MTKTFDQKRPKAVKALAVFIAFLLVFQFNSPFSFSATNTKIFKPISTVSTVQPISTTTATPVSTTSTSATSVTPTTTITSTPSTVTLTPTIGTTTIIPVSNTTSFLNSPTITPTTAPAVGGVQSIGVVQSVDMSAAIGSTTTFINTDQGVSSSFTTPPASSPQVFDNTSGTTNTFSPISAPTEEEGTRVNSADAIDYDFFFADQEESDSNSNNNNDNNNTNNNNTSNNNTDNNNTNNNNTDNNTNNANNPANDFLGSLKSNSNSQPSGGGGGGSSGSSAGFGDSGSRSGNQPYILANKFAENSFVGFGNKLLKLLFGKQNKEKYKSKNKKQKKKKGDKESAEEVSEDLEVQDDQTSVEVDQTAVTGKIGKINNKTPEELEKQKDISEQVLKPILKQIQKDNLTTELTVDIIQDLNPVFSFRPNAQEPGPAIETPKSLAKLSQRAGHPVVVTPKTVKVIQLANKVTAPFQLSKTNHVYQIAQEEGVFIHESDTGRDVDHVPFAG